MIPEVWRSRSSRFERRRPLADFVARFDATPHVGKGRDVFCDGIGERELAVLDQNHRGNRRDRLRHREQSEDGVGGDRTPAFDVAHPEAFEIDGTTVLLDQNDGTRHRADRNVIADEIADPLQLFARKACGSG